MSLKREDLIWQPDKVLPYLFGELKQKIEAISPVEAIYLYGSRAKAAPEQWADMPGKDWDILIVCRFPVVNTKIWTKDAGYYIDLKITDKKRAEAFFLYEKHRVELFKDKLLKHE